MEFINIKEDFILKRKSKRKFKRTVNMLIAFLLSIIITLIIIFISKDFKPIAQKNLRISDSKSKYNYLAVDLGATSGRLILDRSGELKEIYRFGDYLKIDNNGRYSWDIDFIYKNLLTGIKIALKECPNIASLAIDTWGVDYVLLNNDVPIYPVYSYRDPRTEKSSKDVHNIISFEELYKITGIQLNVFNTIYQLKDDLDHGRLKNATDFLYMPEYFSYKLTGKKLKEYTMASTSGILDLKTGEYSKEIINKLNFPSKLFPKKLSKPGSNVGGFKDEVIKEVGGNIKVILTASHDTAAAFESVDVDSDTIIVSSGTWSLMGIKLKEGDNSRDSLNSHFTNEGGVDYIRYLKNIMGLWIFNEVRRKQDYSIPEINQLVEESNYKEIFDVNDNSLLAPADMRDAIMKLLVKNPPKTDGDVYRSIYYSLAKSYADSANQIEHNLKKKFNKICIVGGGAKNTALNKIIEKVTKRQIVAMPIEASAIGNIKIQKQFKN